MSSPRDTLPDFEPGPLPGHDDIESPIPAGKAHLHVAGAFADLVRAVYRLEAVCSAIARQLDATTKAKP